MEHFQNQNDAAPFSSEGAASFVVGFVVDVAQFVNEAAEDYSPNQLGVNYKHGFADKTDLAQRYFKKSFAIENINLALEVRDILRAALKFYPAVQRAIELAQARPAGAPATISFGSAPVSVLQHFFIASELRFAKVTVAQLQIVFATEFGHAPDEHFAIARHFGYALHDGSK